MNQAPKRSAVHHVQARLGACFVDRQGWEVASAYGDVAAERKALGEAVGLVDASGLGTFECRGPWVASLEWVFLAGSACHRIAPGHAVWIVEPEAREAVFKALEAKRTGQARSYLLDTSSGYATFELCGPRAFDVLVKMGSLEGMKGRHARFPLAGVPVLVVRKPEGFQLHFSREFGPYLWECLLEAGEEFGIRPVGTEAWDAARGGE